MACPAQLLPELGLRSPDPTSPAPTPSPPACQAPLPVTSREALLRGVPGPGSHLSLCTCPILCQHLPLPPASRPQWGVGGGCVSRSPQIPCILPPLPSEHSGTCAFRPCPVAPMAPMALSFPWILHSLLEVTQPPILTLELRLSFL